MNNNNKSGAALVNVLIIAMFVMVLASTIASIAWSNYRMKLVSLNSKNNFYSCEALLDQVRVGLRNDLAEQIENSETDAAAFSKLFTAYAQMDTDGKSIAHANSTSNPNSEGIYDMSKIVSLIKSIDGAPITSMEKIYDGKTYPCGYVLKGVVDEVETEVTISSDQSTNNLFLRDTYIYLEDIKVTYKRNGYENSISSDIKINFVGTVQVEAYSKPLEDFSIFSFGGLDLSGSDAGNLIVYGNIYLSQPVSLDDSKKNALYVDGNVHNGTITFICTGDLIIIDGNVSIINGAVVQFPYSSKIYVNGNITVDANSTLDIGNSTLYFTKSDISGNEHAVSYNSDKCEIDDEKIVSILYSQFPTYTYDEILEEGTIRKIGSNYMNVGTSNPYLFGSGAQQIGDIVKNGVGFNFTTNTTASSGAYSVPNITVFRSNTDNTNDGAAFGYYQGMLVSKGALKIIPNRRYHDNNFNVDSTVLIPLGYDNLKTILGDYDSKTDTLLDDSKPGLTLNCSGSVPIVNSDGSNNGTTGSLALPVRYLFKDFGNVKIGPSGSASGSVDSTKHVAMSISYANWIRE